MSWVIQCPKHGKVISEYRYDGLARLEEHSKEDETFDETCFLYEDTKI